MQTRGIVKRSGFARAFAKIGDFFENYRRSSSGFPREQALLRKNQGVPRKSPEKWTFLSLAFYNAPLLHTESKAQQRRAGSHPAELAGNSRTDAVGSASHHQWSDYESRAIIMTHEESETALRALRTLTTQTPLIRKILAPINRHFPPPPKTQNTPPPKTRNFMDMAFPAERTHFSRRP